LSGRDLPIRLSTVDRKREWQRREVPTQTPHSVPGPSSDLNPHIAQRHDRAKARDKDFSGPVQVLLARRVRDFGGAIGDTILIYPLRPAPGPPCGAEGGGRGGLPAGPRRRERQADGPAAPDAAMGPPPPPPPGCYRRGKGKSRSHDDCPRVRLPVPVARLPIAGPRWPLPVLGCPAISDLKSIISQRV